jgi:hypothetical protein
MIEVQINGITTNQHQVNLLNQNKELVAELMQPMNLQQTCSKLKPNL